jgi:predicted RNase H-like HicB family nuclease
MARHKTRRPNILSRRKLAIRKYLTVLDPSDKMGRMKKSRGHFNVVLRPEPEGGFTAIVPVLPGCVTYGRTLAEAKKMARDAISGYIESLKKHGETIPTDDESLIASLDLEYAETSGR